MSNYAKNLVTAAIDKRDITVREYCKNNKINYNSFMCTTRGSLPIRSVALFLATNDPELFNLLPDNSKKILKSHYVDCNIPRE